MSTEYVMKRKQAQWVDDHTNTARVKRFGSHMVHFRTHGSITKALWIKSIQQQQMMNVSLRLCFVTCGLT